MDLQDPDCDHRGFFHFRMVWSCAESCRASAAHRRVRRTRVHPHGHGCLVLAAGGTATAQTIQTIGFDEAIAKTLASNPELRAFGYSIEAQQGRIQQANLRPAVELDVEIENVLGTGDYSGTEQAQATIGLVWALET